MTCWIPTARDLPAMDLPVWLYQPDIGVGIGCRSAAGDDEWLWATSHGNAWWDAEAGAWQCDAEQDDDYQPTHWQPLPVPPGAGLGAGTDLYRSVLAFNDDDPERKALMARVWRDTPWMVNAYTGSHDTDRRHDLMEWCHEQFGTEAGPIHGRPGSWHSGGATVHGWTWMGFATEDQMRQFMARWPAPNVGGNNGDRHE